VINSRAAADRRSTTLEQVARDLAARHGLVEDVESRVQSHDSFHR
jgi:phage protein D